MANKMPCIAMVTGTPVTENSTVRFPCDMSPGCGTGVNVSCVTSTSTAVFGNTDKDSDAMLGAMVSDGHPHSPGTGQIISSHVVSELDHVPFKAAHSTALTYAHRSGVSKQHAPGHFNLLGGRNSKHPVSGSHPGIVHSSSSLSGQIFGCVSVEHMNPGNSHRATVHASTGQSSSCAQQLGTPGLGRNAQSPRPSSGK